MTDKKTEEDMVILEGTNLNKTYRSAGRTVTPLREISFQLHRGEVLGIVGESGSGKSTLLRVACGLERPESGRVLAGERDLTGAGPSAAGKYMQMIFQDAGASFNSRHTMRWSLEEAIPAGADREQAKQQMRSLLRETGMSEDLLDRHPSALSGGQCQRMSIVRALLSGAQILLCDEITSALDVTSQAQVIRLLRELRENRHLSILFVSHDLALVSMLCDRVMVMKEGACVEEGETQKLIREPVHAYTKELLGAAESFAV